MAGTWFNNKKITSLWTNQATRNAFAGVEGLGWRKIADNIDNAHVALTILAAHAKQTNRNANVLIDQDKIVQIYAW